eukprot:CAMPEP_0180187916 /NCGR_PEP_ID=MMETSP0986-20121125/43803_1 /TAXON_ID=697907 /ORGANISM="non described non described, Strain CCMP2293" /LENGTH=113 /DNA_ID=CAMNT_0022142081 /DNA_START=497 /DNA_END=835 /DNA_ORIENTATION=-
MHNASDAVERKVYGRASPSDPERKQLSSSPPPPQQVRWARLGARHALKISPDLLVQQEIRRSLLALREKGGRNGRVDFHKSPQPPCFSQRPPRMSVVPSLLLSDVSDSDAHRR